MKLSDGSLGLLLIILSSVVQGILIVGPKRIYPGRKCTIVISNFADKRVDLSLTLERTNLENPELLANKTVDIRSSMNKLVDFNIPEVLPQGDYRITIIGINGYSFSEEITVIAQTKIFAGLIQLNKPVYKPGDTVNFRVIVLDSELNPPKNLRRVSISIENPDGNTVGKWSEALLNLGVFEGSLPIATEPKLGKYTIFVESQDEELVHKTFEVQEYVLSGINVDVFPTKVPVEADNGIDFTVSAKNVFDQPIQGTVNLTLYSKKNLLKTTASLEVNGIKKHNMSFGNQRVQIEYEAESEDLVLNYTFVERYTNRTLFKSVPITVYKSMYRAKLMKEISEFFPGHLFNANVKVEHQDGSPAKNVTFHVEVDGIVGTFDKNLATDNNGVIPLQLMPSDDEEITIEVSIGGNEVLSEEISKGESYRDTFVKIEQNSSPRPLNSPIVLQISLAQRTKFFVYYVLAKGNVVDQGYIRTNKRKSKLSIPFSASMVPKAKVFVATLFQSTVRYDIQDIVFDDLSNNFDMVIENNLLPPGKQITLEMLGRKGSYVALAAYDKSLLQYGATHDLFYSNVQELFEGFYAIEENEMDIFQSIGLFARVSDDTPLAGASITAKQSERSSQLIPYRTDFAESFLWINTNLDRDGRKTFIEYVPDSTTAWCLTGFSMDPTYGFGIVKKPLEFNTVKAFYIVDHLPYSLKQDEQIALQFTIFNNLGGNYFTKVKLFNVQDAFEFMEADISDGSKIVTAMQSVGTHVSFLVKAKKLGEIAVRVKATNMIESDAIEKVIRVMPKSLVKKEPQTRIFSSESYTNQSFIINLSVNKFADVGSVKISFVLEPNLLSKVIDNLGELIDVPASTGESNMINFVPNVAILDYLMETAPNHAAIKKAKILLRNSFQNQLKYRVSDGSFKDFEGSNSSIFLTAFVAKSIQTASKYLPEVEAKMLDQAFDWLAEKQHNDGKFEEIGPIVLKDMQTTSRKSIALTSYVITAFLENPNTKQKYSNIVKKGVDYILQYKDNIEDSFDLAIAAYALSLYDSGAEALSNFKKGLLNKANMTAEIMYWPRESHSVQTTAYALLAILNDKDFYANGILAMRWLTEQRYHTGSFERTQDTFVGLKALTKLAETISPMKNDLTVELKAEKTQKPKIFKITAEDIDTKYFNEISSASRLFSITVSGRGSVLFAIQAEYTLDLRNHKKRFNLDVEKLRNSNNELQMRICTSYIAQLSDTRSNMALIEVNFPSGYVVDNNPISNPTTITKIEKTLIRFGATSVTVHYANMGTEKNCFTITAYRRFLVSLKRPAYVVVEDFHHPEFNAIHVYNDDQN